MVGDTGSAGDIGKNKEDNRKSTRPFNVLRRSKSFPSDTYGDPEELLREVRSLHEENKISDQPAVPPPVDRPEPSRQPLRRSKSFPSDTYGDLLREVRSLREENKISDQSAVTPPVEIERESDQSAVTPPVEIERESDQSAVTPPVETERESDQSAVPLLAETAKGSDQPKPPTSSDAEKRLEWLALTKVTEALENHGLFKHLGYGTTDITIQGIEAKNFQVYITKDGDEITYYITDKDMVSLKAKYGIKNLNKVELEEVIDNLEQKKNFDKIKWDLPKVHAVRTIEKTNKWTDEEGKLHKDPRERKKVLITDQEEKVKEKIKSLSIGQLTETWKAALPWASLGFDISEKKPTDEEKLIYKALHRKISDKTKTKYKQIYENNEKLLKNINDSNEKHKNNIISHEKNIANLYYKSDSYTKEKLEEEFSNYGDCIQAIKHELKERPKENTIKEKIVDYLGKVFTNFESIWKPRDIAYRAIKYQLSGLGFDQLGDGSKTKVDMKGDLYLVSEGDGAIRLTNKQPDNGSALVDVKQLKAIELDKVKYDLKVYALQRPDQSDAEGESKDKGSEILVTDDRDLVARMRKQGWKALPWMGTGIELSQEDKQFYQQYKAFCTDKRHGNMCKELDLCNRAIDNLYWDISEEDKRKQIMEKYKEFKDFLKGKIEKYSKDEGKTACDDDFKSKIENLKAFMDNDLANDYLKKNNIFPVLNEKLQAALEERLPNHEIMAHIHNLNEMHIYVYEHKGSIYLTYAPNLRFTDESGEKVTKKYFADYSDEDLARDKVQWRFVTTRVLLRTKKEGDLGGPEKPLLWVTNEDKEADRKKGEGWDALGIIRDRDVKWENIENASREMVSLVEQWLIERSKKIDLLQQKRNEFFRDLSAELEKQLDGENVKKPMTNIRIPEDKGFRISKKNERLVVSFSDSIQLSEEYGQDLLRLKEFSNLLGCDDAVLWTVPDMYVMMRKSEDATDSEFLLTNSKLEGNWKCVHTLKIDKISKAKIEESVKKALKEYIDNVVI